MGITRSSSGLLTRDTFESVSGWTLGTQWASLNSPTYVCSERSPILAQTPDPTPGQFDASGCREGQLFVFNGVWYLWCDAGDGTNNDPSGRWRPQLAVSLDRGMTWTKKGSWALNGASGDPGIQATNNPGDGSWSGRGISTFNKFGSKYVMHAFIGESLISASLPINGFPYVSDIWVSDTPIGPWTYTRAPLGGSGSGYDQYNYYASSCVKDGATYNLFSGTFASGGQGGFCSFGLATSSSSDGPFSKVGQIFNTASSIRGKAFTSLGINSVLENARIWWSEALNKYVMTANYSEAGDAATTYGNIILTSDSLTDWTNNSTAVQVQSICPNDGTGAIGMCCPFYNPEGLPAITEDGYVPIVFDTDPPDTDGTEVHLYRKLRYAVLEPSPYALDYNTSRTGGSALATARKTLSNTDFTAEFAVEFPQTSAIPSTGGPAFDYRIQANGTDFYRFRIKSTGLALEKQAAGTTLQSSSGSLMPVFGNIHRIRVQISGNRHQAWFDGEQQIDFTDNSSPYVSGSSIGFACSNHNCRIRLSQIREANTMTLTGLADGQVVVMRAAGGIPLVQTTASSGSAVLTHTHFPAQSIDVDGINYNCPDMIFGGDVFAWDRNTLAIGVR